MELDSLQYGIGIARGSFEGLSEIPEYPKVIGKAENHSYELVSFRVFEVVFSSALRLLAVSSFELLVALASLLDCPF
jgi:hypothetical protein